jgi:hypothetical protein
MTSGGRVRIHVVLAAALVAAFSAPLAGQQAIEETQDKGFELVGAVGLMTPIASLMSDPESFGATINVNIAYGIDGTYWTSRKFGVGVVGWYSSAKLQVLDTDFQGAVPDDLGRARYAVGMVEGIYRFRGEGSRRSLEPYLAFGAGVRHLNVDEIANPQVVTSTDPAGTIAGGIRLDGILSRMMIRLEVRNNMSLYKSPATDQSKLQNDMILSFGIGTRFQ